MILIDVTCAACPKTLRLLVMTVVSADGVLETDMGDLAQKVARFRWSYMGPLCPACSDRMRATKN